MRTKGNMLHGPLHSLRAYNTKQSMSSILINNLTNCAWRIILYMYNVFSLENVGKQGVFRTTVVEELKLTFSSDLLEMIFSGKML